MFQQIILTSSNRVYRGFGMPTQITLCEQKLSRHLVVFCWPDVALALATVKLTNRQI